MYDTGAANGEKTSKERKATTKTQANHLPQHKKSRYGTSRRIYAILQLLPLSGSDSASIDVSGRWEIRSEGIE